MEDVEYNPIKWLGFKIRERASIIQGMYLLVHTTAGALVFWVSFTLISSFVVNADLKIKLLAALNFDLVTNMFDNISTHRSLN